MEKKKLNWLRKISKVPGIVPISRVQVVELYSLERVNKVAKECGMKTGWSMDITTQDEDGRTWDFNIPEMRNRVARRVLTDKPLLLIGSPMCTVHSVMNQINHAKMAPDASQARFEYARKHLKFATSLYQLQVQGGAISYTNIPRERRPGKRSVSWRCCQ